MAYGTTSYTAQAIKDRLVRQFGDEAGVQVQDGDIFHWINDGQREIITRTGILKARQTTNLVSGTKDYPVPTDVLKVKSMLVNGLPVEYRSYEEAEEYIFNSDPNHLNAGQPVIWFEWGGTYTFYPTPNIDLAGGIELRYIKAPTDVTVLSSPLSIPDTQFNMLLEYVMAQAYELDEDWQASSVKGNQFEGSLTTALADDASVSVKTYGRITVLEDDM